MFTPVVWVFFKGLSGEKHVIFTTFLLDQKSILEGVHKSEVENVLADQFYDELFMLRWITHVYVPFGDKILSLFAPNLIFWIRNEAWTELVDFGYSWVSDPQKSWLRLDLTWQILFLC